MGKGIREKSITQLVSENCELSKETKEALKRNMDRGSELLRMVMKNCESEAATLIIKNTYK